MPQPISCPVPQRLRPNGTLILISAGVFCAILGASLGAASEIVSKIRRFISSLQMTLVEPWRAVVYTSIRQPKRRFATWRLMSQCKDRAMAALSSLA